MNLQSIHTLVAICAGFLVLFGSVATLFYRLGRLTLQVETLWQFMIRRAGIELLKTGWGDSRSSISVNATGVRAIEPLLGTFFPFYQKLLRKNPNMTDVAVCVEIELKFGDMIVEKICVPNNISEGACLLAIVQTCKKKRLGMQAVT